MCFFLNQTYNSVSGQAGVRVSHHSHPCPHFKAPEDEIPPCKAAAIRFWLYKKQRDCTHSCKWESTFILPSYTCCEIVDFCCCVPLKRNVEFMKTCFFFFFNPSAPQSLRSCHLFSERSSWSCESVQSLWEVAQPLLSVPVTGGIRLGEKHQTCALALIMELQGILALINHT